MGGVRTRSDSCASWTGLCHVDLGPGPDNTLGEGRAMMEAEISTHGSVTSVRPAASSLDMSNAKAFKEMMAPVIEKGAKTVLDMSEIGFVDSSGVGAIMSCVRHMKRAERSVAVCCVASSVDRMFEFLRIRRLVDVFGTTDEAVRSLKGASGSAGTK